MAYPVELTIEYPERLSRWLNNPFLFWIKFILAIPHFIIIAAFGYLVQAVVFIAAFAILFTGRYPNGLYNLVASYLRWNTRMTAYILLMRDDYPPFSGSEEPGYPVRMTFERPERLSRWMWLVKWLLAIPHLVMLMLYAIGVVVVLIIAPWAILFTGRYPKGMFGFVAGFLRWSMRVNAYAAYMMTDQYPPFTGKPSAEVT